MKKAFATILCLLLGFCLLACGTNTVGTRNSAGFSDTPSSEPAQDTEEPRLSLTLDVNTSSPLNADDISSLSLTGLVGYIELGKYPQTIAHHKAVAEMSQTTDATGYYYSTWDGEHYAKITKAKVYGKRFKFSEDSLIKENETYYFKVEPIKWWVFLSSDTVVSGSEKKITLISEMILDSHAFCEDITQDIATLDYYQTEHPEIVANNWAYSDLRGWLNGEFLTKAFSTADEKYLISRATSSVSTPYNAEDGTEKIWVPSATEMIAYQRIYSAFSISTRKHYVQMTAIVTDYARCRNTFMSIYPDYYGCGRYWTYSAGNKTYRVSYVPCDNHDDGGNGESVGSAYMGVRPVICMYADDVSAVLKDVEE